MKTCSEEESLLSIVEDALRRCGYDGLTNDDDCGCTVDDLAPCGGCFCDCFPAYASVDKDGHVRLSRSSEPCGV